jgi:hypothetical protein
MVRVPLPFRGVAVLLLAASTVVGQTPEPPAEFLSLDSPAPNTPPDFLREFSADTRHPLLSLMVDGEVASLDAAPAQDSAKLKPTPKSSAAPAKTAPADGTTVDGATVDGCEGGCLFDGCGPAQNLCPMMPNLLPFACAPPPCCYKCKHKCGHKKCGGCGYDCGNPYLNWPGCGGCCGHRCGHKHCCGCQPYGGGYGGGWNMWGGDGFMDGSYGCGGCFVHCLPLQCCCQKCHKHCRKSCCGCAGYGGYPYGGGWGMGYGGWDGGCGGCCMPPPPCCRKCHHKHGCSYGCGYPGYGYPGWGGCGMASVYAACNVPCCEPCYKHHCFGRHHRCHGCQQPYPYCPGPMMMPCMGCDGYGLGGGGFGMGGGYGMGWDGYGMSGGGYGMGHDGSSMSYDGFASDGAFGGGMVSETMLSGTVN